MSYLERKLLLPSLVLASGLLLGCQAKETAKESAAAPAAAESLIIKAPAGRYTVDLNHASLSFSVSHLGLAPYSAHFRDYTAELTLDPDELSQSSITLSVNPKAIATSYVGDYKATHADSKFSSWEEDLARSERFLMADQHPDVGFVSTAVKQQGSTLLIDGDLSLRGQSHPVQLKVQVSGSTEKHPFSKKGAIGFVAEGQFKRSQYGMTFMQGPGLLGDDVTIRFEGEFHQAS